jgi:DNA-binding response OmpR family regulator
MDDGGGCRVNFLVLEGSAAVRDSLCRILLSFGIKGIPASSRAEAKDILSRNTDIQGALVDIDNMDVGGAAFIQDMTGSCGAPPLKLIVHTAQTNKESVRRMLECGVVGYLLRPFEERSAAAKLKVIVDRVADHNAERKHIRVQPAPDELIRVCFRLSPQAGLLAGKVVDISLGGMAIDLFRMPEGEALAAGTRIDGFELNLLHRQLKPSGTVVACRGKTLAIRFEPLSVRDKPVLESYILQRSSL